MKLIKKIIESFKNIGQNPADAIASAWGRVAASATAASQEDLALIDRLIGGVLLQAAEMQRKPAAEAKS